MPTIRGIQMLSGESCCWVSTVSFIPSYAYSTAAPVNQPPVKPDYLNPKLLLIKKG